MMYIILPLLTYLKANKQYAEDEPLSPAGEADLITTQMQVFVVKDLWQFLNEGRQEVVRAVEYWINGAVAAIRLASGIARC